MNFQRQTMRARVSRRFARVPGQHGDGYVPLFYPISINPGAWGTPWAKVKEDYWKCVVTSFIIIPTGGYFVATQFVWYKTRIGTFGKHAWWYQRYLKFTDMDDPDYHIKWEKLQEEVKRGDHIVTWGGTNFMGSYLWEPGDPEPDIRRKASPAGAH